MRFSASPSPDKIEVFVDSGRGLSIYNDGGKLHGSWYVDVTVITSDSRLKTDIKPLQETLRSLQKAKSDAGETTNAESSEVTSPAQWIISQLRPVSFRYLKGGGRRFGFVADDVEQVLPDMVHEENQEDDKGPTKGLLILDFIALLVSAVQSQQQMLQVISRRGEEHHNTTEHRLAALEHELERVWMEVSQLKAQGRDCDTSHAV